MGSRREARRAGQKLEARPIAAKMKMARVSVGGSRGLRPKSRELAALLPASVRAKPIAKPMPMRIDTSPRIRPMTRSEERRVGKEGRLRWLPDDEIKKRLNETRFCNSDNHPFNHK